MTPEDNKACWRAYMKLVLETNENPLAIAMRAYTPTHTTKSPRRFTSDEKRNAARNESLRQIRELMRKRNPAIRFKSDGEAGSKRPHDDHDNNDDGDDGRCTNDQTNKRPRTKEEPEYKSCCRCLQMATGRRWPRGKDVPKGTKNCQLCERYLCKDCYDPMHRGHCEECGDPDWCWRPDYRRVLCSKCIWDLY